MIAFDNQNRRIFLPLKDGGTGSFVRTYIILPKAYLPYVSISLVMRNKNSKSTMFDVNKHDFTVLPEIGVFIKSEFSERAQC